MLTPTDARVQLAAAAADPLRVLVVGAGVAGMALAQLLRRSGLHPVLVERTAPDAAAGYMLALLPLVDPVLAELGVQERYRAVSVEFRRYAVRGRTGRLLREDPVGETLGQFGDYRGISRGALLEVLAAGGGTITHGATVTAVRESADAITATIHADHAPPVSAEVDLVVAADGLHSRTRQLILGPRQVDGVDTGWGGWVVWTGPDDEPDLAEELWGAGFFLGSYPVPSRLGVFAGAPRSRTGAGPAAFAARVREVLPEATGRTERVLAAVAAAGDPYYWALADRRARRWASGRAVLVGDAAAGFLPTAGVGAAMAMESAWVLARLLDGAGPADVPARLREFEARQRPRVEAAQDNSRRLARLMFRQGRLVTGLRDQILPAVSMERALRPIRRLLAEPPVPGR